MTADKKAKEIAAEISAPELASLIDACGKAQSDCAKTPPAYVKERVMHLAAQKAAERGAIKRGGLSLLYRGALVTGALLLAVFGVVFYEAGAERIPEKDLFAMYSYSEEGDWLDEYNTELSNLLSDIKELKEW